MQFLVELTLEIMSAINIEPVVFVLNLQQLFKVVRCTCRTFARGYMGYVCPVALSVPQVAPAICFCSLPLSLCQLFGRPSSIYW